MNLCGFMTAAGAGDWRLTVGKRTSRTTGNINIFLLIFPRNLTKKHLSSPKRHNNSDSLLGRLVAETMIRTRQSALPNKCWKITRVKDQVIKIYVINFLHAEDVPYFVFRPTGVEYGRCFAITNYASMCFVCCD